MMPITIAETRTRTFRRNHRSITEHYSQNQLNRTSDQIIKWLETRHARPLFELGISEGAIDDFRQNSNRRYGPNQHARLVSDVLEFLAKKHYTAMVRVAPLRQNMDNSGTVCKGIRLSGPAIFAHHAELILGARREIMLQTFQWYCDTEEAPCEPARTIVKAIKDLDLTLNRGVMAYILVDGALYQKDSPYYRVLRSLEDANLRYVAVTVRGFEHAGRNVLHSKSLIVDGDRALLTGANVQPFYNQDRTWFDASFEFRSDAARMLRTEFCEAWENSASPFIKRRNRLFSFVAPGTHNLREWARRRQNPVNITMALGGLSPPNIPNNFVNNVSCLLLDGQPGSLFFCGTPQGLQAAGFRSAIANATFRIRIHTPNFNHDDIVELLVGAVNRGIEVEIVLSKGFNDGTEKWSGGSNSAVVDQLRRRWDDGLPANLTIRWYTDDNYGLIDDNLDALRRFASHAKYMSVDSALAIVGSTNLDTQSFKMSREANLAVFSGKVTTAWDEAFFEPSWARATPVDEDLRFQVGRQLKCCVCLKVHGSMPSLPDARWHACRACRSVYCDTCGYNLKRPRYLSRERRCAVEDCNGITELKN